LDSILFSQMYTNYLKIVFCSVILFAVSVVITS